jgi:hypothetical protein
MGTMGVTTRVASSDTAASVSAALLLSNSRNAVAAAATISVETNNIRVAFRVTPTVGASGIGHLMTPGDSWRIVGRENLEQLQFISAATGVAGAIMITPEY